MAKQLKHAYVNTPHVRVITAADFKSIGVEDQQKAEWNPGNRHVVEVSDAAADKLVELEPGEWKIVDASSTSDGETFEPLGSGEDDDETSGASGASRTARRRTANA